MPETNPLADKLRQDPEQLPHVVILLAAVAKADGTIDDDEREVLQASLERALASTLAPDVVRYVVGRGLQMVKEQGQDEAIATAAKSLATIDVLTDTLRMALEVAGASEGVAPSERAIIEAAATAAGLGDDEVAAICGD